MVEQNLPNAGVPDDNRLSVLPTDTNDDGVPDDLVQSELLYATETFTGTDTTTTCTLGNSYYMYGHENESVTVKVDGVVWQHDELGGSGSWQRIPNGSPEMENMPYTELLLIGTSAGQSIEIQVKQYAYFYRASDTDEWSPIRDDGLDSTPINVTNWYIDQLSSVNLYKREHGRYPLNFAWFYTTPRFHLVDPAESNIIDMFIIT